MGTDFYMQLLSAGVVVAIVEGFFSIIIASKLKTITGLFLSVLPFVDS